MPFDSRQEQVLVDKYQYLVRSAARRYMGMYKLPVGKDYEDLLVFGNIGLIKAIRSYDPDRGFQFSTLAQTVIYRQVERGVLQEDRHSSHCTSLDGLLENSEGAEASFSEKYAAWHDVQGQVEAYSIVAEIRKHTTPFEFKLLCLICIEGYQGSEIAVKLGMTTQGVNVRVRRLKKKLHRLMPYALFDS